MGSRSWCYTLNNFSLEERASVALLDCRYHIYGIERGENDTPHLQGYIEFSNVMRLSAVKKLIPRAHWEKRRGTREQARDYCKKDGDFVEIGNWNAGGQGTRTDIDRVMELVKKQTPRLEIMEAEPNVYARNMRFIEAYRAEIEKKTTRNFREVSVDVFWGEAGSGKTRAAWDADPDLFVVNSGESFPFDGYDGEKSILLDDFYGEIRYSTFLRILDGHQFPVNIKGGQRYANWTKVFITSNVAPESWYAEGLTPAIVRRLSTVNFMGVTKSCNEVAGNTSAATPGDFAFNEEELKLIDEFLGGKIEEKKIETDNYLYEDNVDDPTYLYGSDSEDENMKEKSEETVMRPAYQQEHVCDAISSKADGQIQFRDSVHNTDTVVEETRVRSLYNYNETKVIECYYCNRIDCPSLQSSS